MVGLGQEFASFFVKGHIVNIWALRLIESLYPLSSGDFCGYNGKQAFIVVQLLSSI